MPRGKPPQKSIDKNICCGMNISRGRISGAQILLTRSAAAIAGLAGTMHEAQRVRDMRKYPFWARGTSAELKQSLSPRPERYCAIARPVGTRPNNRKNIFSDTG